MQTLPLQIETRLNHRGFHIFGDHRDKFARSIEEQVAEGGIGEFAVPFYYRTKQDDVLVFRVRFDGYLKVIVPNVYDAKLFTKDYLMYRLVNFGNMLSAEVKNGTGFAELMMNKAPLRFGEKEILTERFMEYIDNIAAIGWELEGFILR